MSKSSNLCSFTEGCLSVPDIRENVKREDKIVIHFLNENFEKQTLELDGLCARVVQHEYDHIEGILCGLPIIYRESGALPEYCKKFGVPFENDNFLPALEIMNQNIFLRSFI